MPPTVQVLYFLRLLMLAAIRHITDVHHQRIHYCQAPVWPEHIRSLSSCGGTAGSRRRQRREQGSFPAARRLRCGQNLAETKHLCERKLPRPFRRPLLRRLQVPAWPSLPAAGVAPGEREGGRRPPLAPRDARARLGSGPGRSCQAAQPSSLSQGARRALQAPPWVPRGRSRRRKRPEGTREGGRKIPRGRAPDSLKTTKGGQDRGRGGGGGSSGGKNGTRQSHLGSTNQLRAEGGACGRAVNGKRRQRRRGTENWKLTMISENLMGI
ncbi:uncharacterized protein ACOB8E_013749 [Sarcophilus harrisii]